MVGNLLVDEVAAPAFKMPESGKSNKVGVIKSPSKSFDSRILKWSSEIINE